MRTIDRFPIRQYFYRIDWADRWPESTGGRTEVYLTTFSDAAKELGIDRKTVAEFVRRLRITPKPMSGKAKGLTRSDVELIRKALRHVDRLALSA